MPFLTLLRSLRRRTSTKQERTKDLLKWRGGGVVVVVCCAVGTRAPAWCRVCKDWDQRCLYFGDRETFWVTELEAPARCSSKRGKEDKKTFCSHLRSWSCGNTRLCHHLRFKKKKSMPVVTETGRKAASVFSVLVSYQGLLGSPSGRWGQENISEVHQSPLTRDSGKVTHGSEHQAGHGLGQEGFSLTWREPEQLRSWTRPAAAHSTTQLPVGRKDRCGHSYSPGHILLFSTFFWDPQVELSNLNLAV